VLSGRGKLTYSNVAATIALVLAAGGGAAYGVSHLNAASVNGVHAARLNFLGPNSVGPTSKFKTVFNHRGLVIEARCMNQSGYFMNARARSKVNNAEIQTVTTGSDPNSTAEANDRDFDKGQKLDLPFAAASHGEGTLSFSTPQGAQVSVTYQADVGSTLGDKKACLLGGTALYSGG
jgi:hypothetical protein